MISKIARETLVRGLDDWQYLAEVAWLVQSDHRVESEAQLIEDTVGVLRELLEAGYVEIGTLVPRFESWGLDLETTLGRVAREWQSLGRALSLGDVCWIANTPRGDGAVQAPVGSAQEPTDGP